MSQKIKLALMVLFTGCLYGGFEFYNFYSDEMPKLSQEKSIKERELASAESELARFQNFVKNIESIKQELKELNLQLESALESMPRSLNFSGLLRNLNQLADNSGVEISGFRPRKADEKEESKFFSTVYIDCQMKGSFTRMLVFFDQVSRLKRILNVDTIKMKIPQEKSLKSSGMSAEVDLTLKAFRFSE